MHFAGFGNSRSLVRERHDNTFFQFSSTEISHHFYVSQVIENNGFLQNTEPRAWCLDIHYEIMNASLSNDLFIFIFVNEKI